VTATAINLVGNWLFCLCACSLESMNRNRVAQVTILSLFDFVFPSLVALIRKLVLVKLQSPGKRK